MDVLGIDIGGSGIKGTVVNTATGELLKERLRVDTPQGAKPGDVVSVIAQITADLKWSGKIGCGVPAVVQSGIVRTASNIHGQWIDTDVVDLVKKATGCPVTAINDADAAGVAEVKFGAGKDMKGLVLMVTIGTGIGTALFTNGILVPNTELGHIRMYGQEAERYAADSVRKKLDLSWKEWGRRFNEYLCYMEGLLWPDLIIVGGGVSKKFEKYEPLLSTKTKVVPAQLLNDAGIVGAAMYAAQNL